MKPSLTAKFPPPNVIEGDASSNVVPSRNRLEYSDSITKPDHLSPNPVDDNTAEFASSVPKMMIPTPSEILNDTSSAMLSVLPSGIVKSCSR